MRFSLVHRDAFTKQYKHLAGRHEAFATVWAGVEYSLRTDPYCHGVADDGIGVALTKPYLDVPALRVAFQVATKTVTLLAIEPQ